MANKQWEDPTVEWSEDDVTYDGGVVTRTVDVRINPYLGIVEDVMPDAFIALTGNAGVNLGAPGPESELPAASAIHGDGFMFLTEDGLLLDASQSIGFTH